MGAAFMHLLSISASQRTVFDQSIIIDTHLNNLPQAESLTKAVKSPSETSSNKETNAVPPAHSTARKELFHTSIIAHAPGWTIFRNLYMSNGTLYILALNQSFPEIRMMISTGTIALNTPENIAAREPTQQDMDFITPEEAHVRWSSDTTRVLTVEGNTLLVNDPEQFLGHYYHFVAELIFGIWSFWFGAWSTPSNTVESAFQLSHPSPPPIHRVIFPHAVGWRDGPGFNAYFLRAAFPSLDVEVRDDWADRIGATSAKDRAWHFPIVLVADRSAAFRGSICGRETQRTASEAVEYMLKRNQLLGYQVGGWWEPLRKAVWAFARVDSDPVWSDSASSSLGFPMPKKIIITYISRQGVPRRKLREADHINLVAALEALVIRKGTGWELVVLQAERMSKDAQVQAAARSTVRLSNNILCHEAPMSAFVQILLGVHGNGLTHLVLMKPTRASAVIEIFYPGGFTHDYHWTARALGMTHYAVWNDRYMTHPDEPEVNYPEGFQGNEIPVVGETIVRLIEEHVDLKLKAAAGM
ncbi:hypothetical protein H0H87_008886 [Tephrocybe sp. NHM501043]|nr:hypothetical protein H0H87_008886 [Tephrocybe sp. NHM501043]